MSKKSQSFLFSAVIFALFLFILSYKINSLYELNKLDYDKEYFTTINYFIETIKNSYHKHLSKWGKENCLYRVKILVINPGIEGYKYIVFKKIISSSQPSLTNFSCNNTILMDQYYRIIKAEGFEKEGYCAIKFWDFLNSNEIKYYYVFYGCGESSSETIREGNVSLYYYNVFPLEKKELFETTAPIFYSHILGKYSYKFSYVVNYSKKVEYFNNQNNWLYNEIRIIN